MYCHPWCPARSHDDHQQICLDWLDSQLVQPLTIAVDAAKAMLEGATVGDRGQAETDTAAGKSPGVLRKSAKSHHKKKKGKNNR